MSRLYTIFFLLITLFSPVLSEGQVITGPEVKLVNNDIYVSFSLNLEDKNLQEIRRGIDKELKIVYRPLQSMEGMAGRICAGEDLYKNTEG